MIKGLYLRKCSECGKGMDEGYLADLDYYCSDECLHKVMTPQEWDDAHTQSDDYYWTEWHDIDGDDTVYTADGKAYTLVEDE